MNTLIQDHSLDVAIIPCSLAELADNINSEYRQAQAAFKRGILHTRNMGDYLLQARERCAHGQWLPWLKAYCPDVPERTAQVSMQIARNWTALEGKSATVADLTINGALKLLAPEQEPDQLPGCILPWNRTSDRTAIAATVRQWPDMRFAAIAYMDTAGLSINEIAGKLGLYDQEIEPFANTLMPPLDYKDVQSDVKKIQDAANQRINATKVIAYEQAEHWSILAGEKELTRELNAIHKMHKRNRDRIPYINFMFPNIENIIGRYLSRCALGLEHFVSFGWLVEADALEEILCLFDYALLDTPYGIEDIWENPKDYEKKAIPRIPDSKVKEYFDKSNVIIKSLSIPYDKLGTATLEELNAEKKRLWDNRRAILHGDSSLIKTI